ncbi:MAG: hypothetical protein ACLFT5_07425, partial [Desulfovermiculus sp.]
SSRPWASRSTVSLLSRMITSIPGRKAHKQRSEVRDQRSEVRGQEKQRVIVSDCIAKKRKTTFCSDVFFADHKKAPP